jgi:hypothetical protein
LVSMSSPNLHYVCYSVVPIHIIEQEVVHDYAPYSPSELIHRVLRHRVFDQP